MEGSISVTFVPDIMSKSISGHEIKLLDNAGDQVGHKVRSKLKLGPCLHLDSILN